MAANRYLVGTNGAVWVNGEKFGNIKKVEIKVKGSFDDVNVVGDFATHSAYTGYAIEGTLTMQKVDSFVLKTLGNAFDTGVMPDIKIITRLTDKSTGKTERVAVSNVQFTEFDIANWESKGLIEEAIPLKASYYKILDMI